MDAMAMVMMGIVMVGIGAADGQVEYCITHHCHCFIIIVIILRRMRTSKTESGSWWCSVWFGLVGVVIICNCALKFTIIIEL